MEFSILPPPDHDLPFVLEGAVLPQGGSEGEKVMSYFSQVLKVSGDTASAEILAMAMTVGISGINLCGTAFTVRTDHTLYMSFTSVSTYIAPHHGRCTL